MAVVILSTPLYSLLTPADRDAAKLRQVEEACKAESERQDKLKVIKNGKPITDKWSIDHVVLFLEGVDELAVRRLNDNLA